MDIGRIQEAVDIGSLATYLQIQTVAGAQALQEKTSHWTSNAKTLQQRSQQFDTLQQKCIASLLMHQLVWGLSSLLRYLSPTCHSCHHPMTKMCRLF
jgi:hypothetical protein